MVNSRLLSLLATVFALPLAPLAAQTSSSSPAQPAFAPIATFPLDSNPLVIRQPALPNRPFSVVGERGAILGQQDGTFELWLLPVKVLHNARLTARLEGYDAPIDLNREAATIEVRPDHTTVTYAHAAITVRQHMFIPRDADQGIATAIVLFEVHAIRRADLTLTFEPSLERMWPAPNFGRPGGGWKAIGTGGAYTLETDNPNFFGVVAMPGSTPGELRPYQERPLTTPMEFHFSYDPARDDAHFFPLLAAISDANPNVRETPVPADAARDSRQRLIDRVLAENGRVAERFAHTADFFAHFFDTRLTTETPDHQFDDALRWAEISIQQARVAAPAGTGLAAGWFTSGDSARPGFGWFFGRDTLWTLYAVNSYGDFALSREAMDFLLARQRDDGKMMHEVSEMAEAVDWPHLPYLYAAADSTPLFLMQMEDYVRSSGDTDYLQKHWDNVERAWRFTRAHTTDGIYDNTQGTGWVEEWKPGLPHQEFYLAALDQQGSESFARLARLAGKADLAAEAETVATSIRSKLPAFRNSSDGFYNFGRNASGDFDKTHSIFPAVAWWSGHLSPPDPDATFTAWSGHGFSTDWGTRSVPPGDPIYDPISYHHGSVWPLYTGWASMAEYRTGRSLSAYMHLRSNVQLTWLQDLGAATEVLSGEFYQPLGRSSSHQLWSSAMILAPAIRGLFGIEADGLRHVLRVDPHLPASWDRAQLQNLAVGAEGMPGSVRLTLTLTRLGDVLEADAASSTPTGLCLVSSEEFFAGRTCKAQPSLHHTLRIPLPAVEVGLASQPAQPGARTTAVKVLSQTADAHSLTLRLEAPAGSEQHLQLRRNGTASAHTLHVEGGDLVAPNAAAQRPGQSSSPATGSGRNLTSPGPPLEQIVVHFAPTASPHTVDAQTGADTYVEQTLTLRW